jgi:hypothetical protein
MRVGKLQAIIDLLARIKDSGFGKMLWRRWTQRNKVSLRRSLPTQNFKTEIQNV